MSKSLVITKTLQPVKNALAKRVTAVSGYFERADEAARYAEEMTDPSRPLRIGMAIIVVTFFGFGVWASVAPIDSAAVAPGVVVVESNRRTIQHLEGGIVHDILVQDGSVVNKGDVLIRLDDTRARAQLAIMQSDLDSNLANEARLIAERDNQPSITFPADLLSRRDNPELAAVLAGQENQFRARKVSLQGQREILEQRIQQYKEQIVGLDALEKSKEVQLRTIHAELDGLYGLLEQGYVTKPRVLALEREAARLEGEMGDHKSSVARSEQGIGETKLQILQLEKTRQEDIAKELHEVQARISEAREKVVAADDVMRRIDIVAPVSGTVMNLQIHTKGGVVSPGAAMMEIVPTSDNLMVECQINPLDIDTVHAGQQVALHVSAADARLTPVIYGKLSTISADRVTDQRTGQAYYKGRIDIPPEQLERLGPDHQLHSGMMVEAMVERGQQTALHYAVKPLLDSLARSFREK